MQAQPEIQGIHDHVELSLQSQVMQPLNKETDIEKDESDLIEAEEHQTESIQGSQVAFALNRMAQQEAKAKKEDQRRVAMVIISSVLILVSLYVGLVLFS